MITIEKLSATSYWLVQEWIDCHRESCVLKKLLQSQEVIDRFNTLSSGFLLEHMRTVYYRGVALRCINALADTDKQNRTVSIGWMHRNFVDIQKIYANKLPEKQTQFDQLKSLCQKFGDHHSPEHLRYRKLRDQVLGHNQLDDDMSKPVGLSDSEVNIKYGELWKLIDSLEVAADLTTHIFRDAEFLFVDTKQIHLRDADRFVQIFKPC